MKTVLFLFALLTAPFSAAEQPASPLSDLVAMQQAHQTQPYEQLYLLQRGDEVETFRYRHALENGKHYAQLLHLDVPREEIILRDNTVSYFGDFQPFSLAGSQIWDSLPSVLYTDFARLEGYDFIDAGRSRVADRIARVIRIVPRDHFRYQYTLWIDEADFLLLRADLLDQNDTLLEQFRAVQSQVSEAYQEIIAPIAQLSLPPLLSVPAQAQSTEQRWKPRWLPAGFKPIAGNAQRLPNAEPNDILESQLYSDGLFSFSLYVLENKDVTYHDHFGREGKISIYSQTIGDKDFVIIGEIPLVSARHILQEMQQNRPLAEAAP